MTTPKFFYRTAFKGIPNVKWDKAPPFIFYDLTCLPTLGQNMERRSKHIHFNLCVSHLDSVSCPINHSAVVDTRFFPSLILYSSFYQEVI